MDKYLNAACSFAVEEDGAQILEYALILAVVSIVMVIALRDLTGTNFNGFINRVAACLASNATCA
jgi:pilus assembly protein Flp/PilA